MKVSVVQSGNCTQSTSENVEMLLGLCAKAATSKPDLILLPELATTPYFAAGDKSPKYRDWAESATTGPSTAAFAKFAKENNTSIAYGMYEVDNDVRYNSLVLIDRSGEVVRGKTHDGNTYPAFRKLTAPSVHMPTLDVHEDEYCTAGPGPMNFKLDGASIGALICYDRAFSEPWLANRALGADIVLLAVSSLGWRESLFIDDLRLRAMETGVFVIAANRSGEETCGGVTHDFFGLSCIIAPTGEVLAQAGGHNYPEIIEAELDMSLLKSARESWPVWTDRRPEIYSWMYKN
jgi:beta-ureidopropionase